MTYDDVVDRWYINAFDGDGNNIGLFLAVSQTNDLTGAWFVYDLTNVGGLPDFAKPGFNKDAIFISYNDFGSHGGDAAVAAVDKAQALAGNLVYFTSNPRLSSGRCRQPKCTVTPRGASSGLFPSGTSARTPSASPK